MDRLELMQMLLGQMEAGLQGFALFAERESVVRALGAGDVHGVLKNRRGAAESGASPV